MSVSLRNPQIANMLLNQPLLARADYVQTALSAMQDRLQIELPDVQGGFEQKTEPHKNVTFLMPGAEAGAPMKSLATITDVEESTGNGGKKAIALVPVIGSLSTRGGYFGANSTRMRGYNEIKNEIAQAAHNEKVGGAALYIDSPGGLCAGNDGLSAWIAEFSKANNFPVWCFCEMACSAAYNIAAACTRVCMPRTGLTGSIGVVMAHVDESRRLEEKLKVDVTYIFSGSHKVDGNSTEPLSAEVKADLQARCDEIYGYFTSLVAENRGTSDEKIRATEAQIYGANDSIAQGLADSILSEEQFYSEFFEHIENGSEAGSTSLPAQQNSNAAKTVYSNSINQGANQMDPKQTTDKTKDESETTADSTPQMTTAEYQERNQKIMTHPNAAANMEKALEMVGNPGITVEFACSMLDSMGAKAQEADANAKDEGDAGMVVNGVDLGDTSGLSAQGKSILQNVAKIHGIQDGGPNAIKSDVTDFAGGEGTQKTRSEVDDEFISDAISKVDGVSTATLEASLTDGGLSA